MLRKIVLHCKLNVSGWKWLNKIGESVKRKMETVFLKQRGEDIEPIKHIPKIEKGKKPSSYKNKQYQNQFSNIKVMYNHLASPAAG